MMNSSNEPPFIGPAGSTNPNTPANTNASIATVVIPPALLQQPPPSLIAIPNGPLNPQSNPSIHNTNVPPPSSIPVMMGLNQQHQQQQQQQQQQLQPPLQHHQQQHHMHQQQQQQHQHNMNMNNANANTNQRFIRPPMHNFERHHPNPNSFNQSLSNHSKLNDEILNQLNSDARMQFDNHFGGPGIGGNSSTSGNNQGENMNMMPSVPPNFQSSPSPHQMQQQQQQHHQQNQYQQQQPIQLPLPTPQQNHQQMQQQQQMSPLLNQNPMFQHPPPLSVQQHQQQQQQQHHNHHQGSMNIRFQNQIRGGQS